MSDSNDEESNGHEPKDSKGTRELISEFFKDAICRIVSGFVILRLYPLLAAFKTYHKIAGAHAKWRCLKSLEGFLLPGRSEPRDEIGRRFYRKHCAEKVMFRGLAIISVLTCVWVPNFPKAGPIDTPTNAVQGLVLEGFAAGRARGGWQESLRAERYWVEIFVIGEDQEFRRVDTVQDSDS
jgi:hypothetical protein